LRSLRGGDGSGGIIVARVSRETRPHDDDDDDDTSEDKTLERKYHSVIIDVIATDTNSFRTVLTFVPCLSLSRSTTESPEDE
jgi:hypothetical protein